MGPVPIGTGDWSTYLHDATRSGHSGNAAGFSSSNASTLSPAWEFRTGGFVAASAVVVGGTVFVGSWDGYEYALNATSGELIWKTYLNQTTTPNCPTTRGVSSTPTVQNGTVYLGGGGEYWYALSASTGAVLWQVFIGNNSATSGHYNWASPLLYDGFAYIGVSSDCDAPLVVGQLLQLNLTTHVIAHTFNTSTKLAHGASVWGSPTVDPKTNLVYIATGNGGPYGSSLIALNATTLALNGSWQVPANQSISDGDFGGTPTVWVDRLGHHFVGVPNKNGIFYAFDDSRLSSGPVWQDRLAVPGACPECGQGSISPATFDGSTLYAAGGQTTIGGINYSGSVRALDPSTGAVRWQHGSPGAVVGGLASIGGMVIDSAGSALEVLNSTTGTRVLDYPADSTLYTAPSVAEGHLFVSSAAGTVYALAPSSGHWLHLFTPPNAMNGSFAYDAADHYSVFFGGCASDLCPTSETWLWAGGGWTNVTPEFLNSSNSPSPRLDAAVAYDAHDGYLLLFGGYAPGVGDLGDTWTFHGGQWTALPHAHPPPARASAAMAFDPTLGAVVMFGGARHSGTTRTDLGDTWQFAGGTWSMVKTAPHGPTPRDAAALAYYPTDKSVVLFGGRTGNVALNDTWELAGKKWNSLLPASSPAPTYGAALDSDNGSNGLLLFGGHSAAATVLSATWTYSAGSWHRLSVVPTPAARTAGSLTYDAADGDSVLYGGMGSTGQPLGDTWKFNGTQWTHEFPSSPGGARYGAGSAYDAVDGYLVIFGGRTPTTSLLSTTMRFTGSGYSALCAGCLAGRTEPSARDLPAMAFDAADGKVILFGGQGAAGPLNDTWSFVEGKWTNLTLGVSNTPPTRLGASLAFDAVDNELVLFGGRGATGVLNDTWMFSNGTWTRVATSGAPSPREGAALAYDAAVKALVLFGGNNSSRVFADTWEFSSGRWNAVNAAAGPSARTYAGMSSFLSPLGSSAILVGGSGGSTYLADVWQFGNGTWVPIFRGVTPGVRSAAVVAYDPALSELLVYGGATGGAGLLAAGGDSWTFGSNP